MGDSKRLRAAENEDSPRREDQSKHVLVADSKRCEDVHEEAAESLPTVTVHVVRHGQVDNPDKVFYGRLPGFDLHENGKEQARLAGKYLIDCIAEPAATLVVASPMLRAQTTPKIIAEKLGVDDLRTEEAVNEVKCPHDGKSMSEMIAINWRIYGSPPEWEQFCDVGERVVSTLRKLAGEGSHAANGGQLRHVVLVSHGDCVACSRLWGMGREFNQIERTRLQNEGYPTYCSVTSLQINAKGQCLNMKIHDVVESNPDGKVA